MARVSKGLSDILKLREQRATDDGRLCVDLAAASWRAQRYVEARQWIKQAIAADRQVVDADLGELIADLKAKDEARAKSTTVDTRSLRSPIEALEDEIVEGARRDGLARPLDS